MLFLLVELFSGGSFNPVVALGLSIMSGMCMSNVFYALLISAANVVGGIVAVGCFRVVLQSEFDAGRTTAKGTVGETKPLQVY